MNVKQVSALLIIFIAGLTTETFAKFSVGPWGDDKKSIKKRYQQPKQNDASSRPTRPQRKSVRKSVRKAPAKSQTAGSRTRAPIHIPPPRAHAPRKGMNSPSNVHAARRGFRSPGYAHGARKGFRSPGYAHGARKGFRSPGYAHGARKATPNRRVSKRPSFGTNRRGR